MAREFPLEAFIRQSSIRPERRLSQVQAIGQALAKKHLENLAKKEAKLEEEKKNIKEMYERESAETQFFKPVGVQSPMPVSGQPLSEKELIEPTEELTPYEAAVREQAGLGISKRPRPVMPGYQRQIQRTAEGVRTIETPTGPAAQMIDVSILGIHRGTGERVDLGTFKAPEGTPTKIIEFGSAESAGGRVNPRFTQLMDLAQKHWSSYRQAQTKEDEDESQVSLKQYDDAVSKATEIWNADNPGSPLQEYEIKEVEQADWKPGLWQKIFGGGPPKEKRLIPKGEVTGRITVRDKVTGQTGTIEERELSPRYERIQ